MKLSSLLKGVVKTGKEIEVVGISVDSRKVKPGFVFVAYKGVEVDGHDYIDQAIERGAVAVVGEADLSLAVPYFRVKNGRLAWAKMEAAKWGNPERKLKFIGVTGTDGKTTTVNLIYEILRVAGKKVGMVSTIKAKIGDEDLETGLHTSSPDADVLFGILAKMVKAGLEYVVLEATSHGLEQERMGDIEFEVGVLTNFAHDHLDVHKTLKNYRRAKGGLFKRSEVAVLNKNCVERSYFAGKAKAGVIYYDVGEEVREVKYGKEGEKIWQEFGLKYAGEWIKMKSYLLGRYNLENILAASKLAEVLGLQGVSLKEGLLSLRRLAGRFEFIFNKRGLNVVVDFAHTEQGVRAVLSMVRGELRGKGEKLIVVFGCNGERDRSKRAPMGKAACELADLVVVTTEDPRNEDIGQIFADIEAGCREAEGRLGKSYFRVDDRYGAIEMAVNKLACKGDWVLVLGKGHEQSMNIMGVEYAWDDRRVVEGVLSA